MIPVLNRKGAYQLSVPQLSGGTNYRDGLNYVKDNQLTDSLNMWFNNGVLKTRPGINKIDTDENDVHFGSVKIKTNRFNTVNIDGRTYTLEAHFYIWYAGSGQDYTSHYICFKLCSKDDSIYIGRIYVDSPFVHEINALPVIYKDDVYVYLRYFEDEFNTYQNDIYKIQKTGEKTYGEPQRITANLYAPLVLTNCTACFKDSGSVQAMLNKGATQVEGFNLLGNQYRMIYSTFDNSPTGFRFYPSGKEENPSDYLTYTEYSLPYTEKGTSGLITVEYVDKSGQTHNHSVYTPHFEPTVESQASTDKMYLHAYIKGNIVHITLNYENENTKYEPMLISVDDYVHNNMTVTAPCKNSDENWAMVMDMTQAIWYGNTALGLFGGSRLFLGGNRDSKNKALVIWSDFDNPLYFSENNYVYIGDKSQKVTAFGRQGSSLIVFKEKEIYSGEYSVTSVSADELIQQTAIDAVNNTARFTFSLIHSLIGCDCPESIQLCLNRLIWATTEGKIYTLTDRNQYSERNVLTVSLMVEDKLKQEDLSTCYSADWHGFYLLFCNDLVYAMNYNSYGYMNISAYTQNYNANMLIPWFCWQLPEKIQSVYAGDDDMVMVFLDENENESTVLRGYFDFSLQEDLIKDKTPITSMVQTKVYDFGYFHRLKKINRVSVSFGVTKSAGIKVESLTESGLTDIHMINVNGKDLGDYTAMVTKQIIPSVKICQSFGIRFTCNGNLELKAINIGFKLSENIM